MGPAHSNTCFSAGDIPNGACVHVATIAKCSALECGVHKRAQMQKLAILAITIFSFWGCAVDDTEAPTTDEETLAEADPSTVARQHSPTSSELDLLHLDMRDGPEQAAWLDGCLRDAATPTACPGAPPPSVWVTWCAPSTLCYGSTSVTDCTMWHWWPADGAWQSFPWPPNESGVAGAGAGSYYHLACNMTLEGVTFWSGASATWVY